MHTDTSSADGGLMDQSSSITLRYQMVALRPLYTRNQLTTTVTRLDKDF